MPQFLVQIILQNMSKGATTVNHYLGPLSTYIEIINNSTKITRAAATYNFNCKSDNHRKNLISCAAVLIPVLEAVVFNITLWTTVAA